LFRLRESKGKVSQPAPDRSDLKTKLFCVFLLLVLVGGSIWAICKLSGPARSLFSNNDRGWDAKLYADLSWDSIKKKDYDAAIREPREAIRLDPNYARAYTSRGVAYRRKKDYDRAIADFTEAIRLDPNYAHAYNSRGFAYESKKEYDRAIADFTE